VNITGALGLNIVEVNTSAQALGPTRTQNADPRDPRELRQRLDDSRIGCRNEDGKAGGKSTSSTPTKKASSSGSNRSRRRKIDGTRIRLQSRRTPLHPAPQELGIRKQPLETGNPVIYHDGGNSPIGSSAGSEA